jgi:hypothetical protein
MTSHDTVLKLRVMRVLLLFLFVSLPVALSVADAASLALPSDVATVVSAEGKYDARYSNAVRDRFIIRKRLGGEGTQIIVIEKFAPGREGLPDRVITTQEFAVSELPLIKEDLAEASKKSVEATYGCCNVDRIKRVGASWLFSVKSIAKGVNGTAKDVNCKSAESPKSEVSINCSAKSEPRTY